MKKFKFSGLQIFFLYLLLFACVVPPITSRQAKSFRSAYTYYNRSLKALEAHNYPLALSELDSAIALQPAYAHFYYAKGEILELLGQPDSAIVQYEKALQRRSNFPEVWEQLARLYLQTQQFRKAIRILNNLIEAFPDSLNLRLQMAEGYLGNHQPRMAMQQLNIFHNRGGNSPEFFRLEGETYFYLGEYHKARENLSRYVAYNQNDTRVLKELGFSCLKTGELELGMHYLSQALQKDRRDPQIYLYRAHYFLLRNKLTDARDQIQIALKIDSTNANAQLEMGKILVRLNQFRLAEEFLNKARKLNPSDFQAYGYLAVVAYHLGDEQKARQYLQIYLEQVSQPDPFVLKQKETIFPENLPQPN